MQTILTRSINNSLKKASRCIWVKPRSKSFWYETMTNDWDGEDWIKNMRMSNNTFNLQCNALRSHISKEDSGFRKCIPAESNLAATLYYLYNFVFELICLGLGRSTVCSIVHMVCKQIVRNLLKT